MGIGIYEKVTLMFCLFVFIKGKFLLKKLKSFVKGLYIYNYKYLRGKRERKFNEAKAVLIVLSVVR